MAEEIPTQVSSVPVVEEQVVVAEPVKPAPVVELVEEVEGKKITQSVSFKEETNVVSELPDLQKKALDELKSLVQEALNKHEFSAPPPPPPVKVEDKPAETEKTEDKPAETEKTEDKQTEAEKTEEKPAEVVVEEKVTVVDDDGAKTVEAIEETVTVVQVEPPPAEAEAAVAVAVAEAEETKEPEEVSIWGIPLLKDEKSDVILLKFLRARDFKPKESLTMMKNTVLWRKEFGIESLLDEETFGNELDKVVFTSGFDKESHPVCYNVYGAFEDKDLYQKCFADEEKRKKFLKWRIQFLEKSIRKLDFSPKGINTNVQVNDLKNFPGFFKRELRTSMNQALTLLQDNYPEFVAKQVFINVPWWYLAFNKMISPFLTQRAKSKFVFAGPSKSTETLFKYIAPEQVPVQYGGFYGDEKEFTTSDPLTEVSIKPASKHTVEIPVTEASEVAWEIRVVDWNVNYGAEFLPSVEGGYTVIVSKSRKVSVTDEAVISDSFKIGEAGKVVITIDNQTSKKKLLFYRFKIKGVSC